MAIHQVFLYNLSSLGSYSGGTVRDLFDNGSTGEGSGAIGEAVSFANKSGQVYSISDNDSDFDQTDGDQVTSGGHTLQGWTSGTNISNYSVPSGSRTDVEYGYELTPLGGGPAIWVYAVATNYPSVLDTNGFTSTGPIDPSETYTIIGYDTSPDPLYSTMVPCFCFDTLIETDTGTRPVGDIRPGDRVLTRDHGFQPVIWTEQNCVDGAVLAALPALAPIRIAPGALGQNMPSRPLRVSPQHRILIRSAIAKRMFQHMEVLVSAKNLLGLPGIAQEAAGPEIVFVHLALACHHILKANGAWAESFLCGKVALRALPRASRKSLLTCMPGWATSPPAPARPCIRGHKARQLAERINKNSKTPVTAP